MPALQGIRMTRLPRSRNTTHSWPPSFDVRGVADKTCGLERGPPFLRSCLIMPRTDQRSTESRSMRFLKGAISFQPPRPCTAVVTTGVCTGVKKAHSAEENGHESEESYKGVWQNNNAQNTAMSALRRVVAPIRPLPIPPFRPPCSVAFDFHVWVWNLFRHGKIGALVCVCARTRAVRVVQKRPTYSVIRVRVRAVCAGHHRSADVAILPPCVRAGSVAPWSVVNTVLAVWAAAVVMVAYAFSSRTTAPCVISRVPVRLRVFRPREAGAPGLRCVYAAAIIRAVTCRACYSMMQTRKNKK